jgi:hypothetical protein
MSINILLENFNRASNLQKEESTDWIGKKSQIGSTPIGKNLQIYFLKILNSREFRIFKNRIVDFYLHSTADLQFSSF